MRFLAVAGVFESALEFAREVAAGAEEDRFFCAGFAAKPFAQFIGRGDGVSAFAADRHSGFCPALCHGHGLAEEFCDLRPALKGQRRRSGFGH